MSLLTLDGRRYIATVGETDWVRNARAAGRGILSRGRQQERVALVEVAVEARAPILREVPRQLPRGVEFYQHALGLPNDPEAFAAAAPQCPVFRVDTLAPAVDEHVAR